MCSSARKCTNRYSRLAERALVVGRMVRIMRGGDVRCDVSCVFALSGRPGMPRQGRPKAPQRVLIGDESHPYLLMPTLRGLAIERLSPILVTSGTWRLPG